MSVMFQCDFRSLEEHCTHWVNKQVAKNFVCIRSGQQVMEEHTVTLVCFTAFLVNSFWKNCLGSLGCCI